MIHQGISEFMRELRKYKYFESSFGYFYNNFKVKAHYKDDFAEVFVFKYSEYYMSDREYMYTFSSLFLEQIGSYSNMTFVYRVDKEEVYIIFENDGGFISYINLAKNHNLPCFENRKNTMNLKFWTVEHDDK